MIHPFILGAVAAVAAKPVIRYTYKGAAKLKAEAEKLAEETEAELNAKALLGDGGLDPVAIQQMIQSAVNQAVKDALASSSSKK